MERWRGLDAIPADWGRCVLTMGTFDGVHRGHQKLITRAVEAARALGVPAVLMTFDPHPAEVIHPGSHPALLTTLRRRAELVAELGIDAFLVVPFTAALAATSPEEFVHDIVVDRLHAAEVVVGDNFRFGDDNTGSVQSLSELGRRSGFRTTGVSLLADTDNTGLLISSTSVRAMVAAGSVSDAAVALGRPHRLEGFVVHGEGRGGSQLGYPTANLDVEPHSAVPADGIYAGWFLMGSRRSPTAISIGTNPTFSGQVRTVEAFVMDEGGNFYGRRVALDFVERLRSTERFDSVEALVAQIDRDVARTREVLQVS
ncbi:bifunctional riboflavin kinase/FAD synthetase [Nakamurella leprariae]|uniref:Riboflavin biosynthesis protein n=1 Tax=Nakamurella leprariae TaxID=2803911 RepID=A0A938YA58_9ACTN|nr:bifunctional riboflavin kinase/FAD synthetase [Nakamurella leprariae]MBM9465883.1 bifunctional riboflavin kinase/FAD synthetase [Nakamurella leprariae]